MDSPAGDLRAFVYVFFAFVAGLVFGIGLLVSRTADPSKALVFVVAMLAGTLIFEGRERARVRAAASSEAAAAGARE